MKLFRWYWRGKRPTVYLLFLLTGIVVFAGCGGGGGGGAVPDEPGGSGDPTITISGFKIRLPEGFSATGGVVGISATIAAEKGVASVKAVVINPDGVSEDVLLAGTGDYSADYKVKGNMRAGISPVQLLVHILVTDTEGKTRESEVLTIEVPAPSPPPPVAPTV